MLWRNSKSIFVKVVEHSHQFSSVQSLSHVWLFVTHGLQHARLPCPSPTPRACSFKLLSIESVVPSNHLILCRPLSLLPLIFPSIRVFCNESVLHQVVKVLELQLQHQSLQWIFRVDFFEDWLVWSPCSPRLSRVFSNTTVQKHQFFRAQPSL